MAWLFLDTHESGLFYFGFLEGSVVKVRSGRGRSHALLAKLAAAWKTHSKKIEGICVVEGPGSFSAVRIGVLYANLLSRFLGKPLVGISVDETTDLSALGERLARGAYKQAAYVAPIYDAPPNITFPRV